MPQVKDVLAYARKQADSLTLEMTLMPATPGYPEYWKATSIDAERRIEARVTAALDFISQYTGAKSTWSDRAVSAVHENKGDSEAGARILSHLLLAWADQVDAGMAEVAGARAWAEVGVVSTDLMGQVRRLLEDTSIPPITPAAPIVLCGAALEIALRAVYDARSISLPAKLSMKTLTDTLRTAGLLTVQDVKDLDAVGGLRNQAAHGEFAALSSERAGLMEQQCNLLLGRLADLIP